MHVFIVGRGFRFRFVSFPVPAFITCPSSALRISRKQQQQSASPEDSLRTLRHSSSPAVSCLLFL